MNLRISCAVLLLCILAMVSTGWTQQNLHLLSNVSYSQNLNDVWGYVDSSGTEYALVGLRNGLSIVDLSDPENPVEVQFVPGPVSTWRDIKVQGDYAYMTNEAGGGLQVVDLSNLPASVSDTFWTGDGSVSFTKAHNIFIDENGVGYIVGANHLNGGAIFIDLLTDPFNPVVLGIYDLRYVHDCFARGDTLWTAEVFDGIFSVIDVSNKSNPVVMATQSTPSSFTHNVWLTDDGETLLTTDEVSSGFIAAYDVSDLSNITLLDQYQSNPGSGVLPHNVTILGDFAIASYYDDGVIILDLTQPNNLFEVGNFDTSPFNTGGCWGIYPYLPSGIVLATDITEGLFVLEPNYVQAAYIQGTVRDFNTTIPINGASVSIMGSTASALTNISGQYALATSDTGTINLLFGKPGYASQVASGVQLQNGAVDTIDVSLSPAAIYTLTGSVKDRKTGAAIPDAKVLVENNFASYTAKTNSFGEFAIGGFPAEVYTVIVYRWGYRTDTSLLSLSPQQNNIMIELDTGYVDDFAYNLGWTVSGDATDGHWTRETPIGTVFSSALVNPPFDVESDAGNVCMVTGNGVGTASAFDVDFGTTTLISPAMDLTSYSDPYVQFNWWFYAEEGAGSEGDGMTIVVSDGMQSVAIDSFDLHNAFRSQWNTKTFRLVDYIGLSDSIQVSIAVSDIVNQNIVDAGVDNFKVIDGFVNIGCQSPGPVFHTVKGYDEVDLFWNAVAGAESYILRGRQLGANDWITIQIPDGATSSLNLMNLISPAIYEWQIQAVCDGSDSIFSPFSELDTIELKCFAPANPLTTAIGGSTALLLWSEVPGAAGYLLAGRQQGSAAIVTINLGASPIAYPAVGLMQSTTYEWAIKTKCDPGVYSDFSAIQAFVTSSGNKMSNASFREDLNESFLVYPNPADKWVKIVASKGTFRYELFSVKGELLLNGSFDENGTKISLENLSQGMYYLKIGNLQTNIIKKLIKY